jgi:hypothetical protein
MIRIPFILLLVGIVGMMPARAIGWQVAGVESYFSGGAQPVAEKQITTGASSAYSPSERVQQSNTVQQSVDVESASNRALREFPDLQIADHSLAPEVEQGGVFSGSSIQLSGNLSLVGLLGTSRAFVPWNPLFMLPPSPFDVPTNSLEIHGRQSSFQALFQGPKVDTFQSGGLLKVYLLANSLTSDTYGLMPVVALGELKNDRWRFSGGLQPDLFAPRDPVVIPTVLLGGSGNPGTFRGQLRVERYLVESEALATTLQFALSDPLTTVLIDSSRRTTESNGWPNIESRLLWGLGPVTQMPGGRNERTAEVAVAGVLGQIRNTRLVFDLDDLNDPSPPRQVVDVWGVSVDGKWNMTRRLGIAGEFFTGEAIGNYAANIFQTFNPTTFQPIRGSGGWGEVFVYLTGRLHVHNGYGIEAPERDALPINTGIARNETWYTNWVWEAHKCMQISFEVDYRKTEFISLERGSGAMFISQFLWRF